MRPKVDMMLQYFRTKVTCPVASGSFRESKMTRCSNEEDTVLVEMVDVEELPFSIPNVCNAVENMYRTYEMEHFAKQNFNTSDETIMATSFFTYDYGEGIMHARLRQVAQYFTTETYAAFVSTFIVELLTQTQGEEVPVDKVQEWRIVSATDDGTTLHQTFAVLLPKIAHSMATLSDSKQLFSQLVGAWLANRESAVESAVIIVYAYTAQEETRSA
uniref:Uncharacterized protein n=1 Tax=Globisporangium ultimum (strain ATCC 200006 / CBS 805.95 / DAOM BR144) TaxID=431595 RepID=K3WSK0_GLOUD